MAGGGEKSVLTLGEKPEYVVSRQAPLELGPPGGRGLWRGWILEAGILEVVALQVGASASWPASPVLASVSLQLCRGCICWPPLGSPAPSLAPSLPCSPGFLQTPALPEPGLCPQGITSLGTCQ